MTDNALAAPVERFIEDLTPVLGEITRRVKGVVRDTVERDVALDAFNLAAAFVDADGLQTDDELWAFIATFGPRFDTVLRCPRPGDLRKAGLLTGKRSWLDTTSSLFELLVADDRREGTRNAWRYYEDAMAVAHAVCSLDDHPAHAELVALDQFRSRLLRAMEEAGVPRAVASSATAAPPDVAAPEQAPPRPIEELLAELDGLVGLAAVKAEVKLVANLIQVQNLRRQRGLPVPESSRHLVFTGNPGTGKTTVARLLAQIYRTLHVVERGHLVETDRVGLVAGFVGQTAIQVQRVFTSALGGVLLIDEAYALARGDQRDFGQEATDTLVKLIEDHRDDVVVIAAGYPEEMAHFLDSNPGLRSRFPKTIFFADYTDDELVQIFEGLCRQSRYACTTDSRAKVRSYFAAQPRGRGFGNGRLARNLFEQAVAQQASRIVGVEAPTDEQLVTFEPADIPA